MTEHRTDANGVSTPPGSVESDPQRERILLAVEALRSNQDAEGNFRVLFDAYYRPLQRFFVRKGFSSTEAMDLTQETFLGIYKGLEGLREEARFEAWLYRVATTTYLKRVRAGSAAKRAGLEVAEEDTTLVDPRGEGSGEQLSDVLDNEKRRVMRQAIEGLPDKMRKCMILRIYHELAYREIATMLKIKIDTVKAHLFQGRARLKQELEAYSIGALEEPLGGEP